MSQTSEFIETVDEGEIEDEGLSFQEYDITSSPNDFNVKTIVDFIDQGIFKIPVFQRNYVWDMSRASKLIESSILGLPIPQLFLYEQARNKYLVIDGQQRLMSLYYFLKMRFPLADKRNDLREIFDRKGNIPSEIFSNDSYFSKFNLKLPSRLPQEMNKLHGLNYHTLGDLQTTLDLRTIRCVFIKQNFPQEIRISLYPSAFMKMVLQANRDERWRNLIAISQPDLRMRDVEILLRGFAMLSCSDRYAPSMTRFLNKFAKDMQDASDEEIQLLEKIFSAFLDICHDFPTGIFGTQKRKLNISIFESVFLAAGESGYKDRTGSVYSVCRDKIEELKKDPDFLDAASTKSTNTDKVQTRLRRAKKMLIPKELRMN